jgi:uncharacterized membrane protein
MSASDNAVLFRSNWIVGKKYDLFFFIGSCVFTLLFFGIYRIAHHFDFVLSGDSVLITYFLFTAFFDHPHIFQTFSRTHQDKEEFEKHKKTHTWGLLFFILLGFFFVYQGWESELIVGASIYGSYHIIRQHYGFLRAYKGLNKDTLEIDNWLDYGTFYSGMFACFFNDYTDVKGPIVVYGTLRANFPALPPDIEYIAWNLFIFFFVLFIVRQIWRMVSGEGINLPKILLMSSALSTHYFIFYATATPFLIAEALETAYHDIQYQGWMMRYQEKKYPNIKKIALKWFAVSMIYGIIVGVIEIYGLMHKGWAMWLFVPFTMVVVYHYYVDGIIWKFGKDPELRKLMFEQKNEEIIPSA